MSKTLQVRTWPAVLGLLLVMGCGTMEPGRVASVAPYRPIEVRSVPRPGLARVGDVEPVPLASVATNIQETVSTSGRVLKGGDRVQVVLYVPPEPMSSAYVVDEQGNINMPLIGPFRVAGRTCAEAQRLIEKEYVDQKIYKTVTVNIVPPESEYSIIGEMVRPGSYPLTRPITLTQALSKAGKYTDFADQKRVFLTRNNERTEINVLAIREGKSRDIIIIPGDVIEVPRSPW